MQGALREEIGCQLALLPLPPIVVLRLGSPFRPDTGALRSTAHVMHSAAGASMGTSQSCAAAMG